MSTTFVDVRGNEKEAINLRAMPVKVVVGPIQECFFIHDAILRRSSRFFQAALKEEWLEGRHRTIKLPEEDPDVFHKYIQWLYAGKIFGEEDKDDRADLEDDTKIVHDCDFDRRAKLYALGETLLDSTYQDRVLDAFVADIRGNEDSFGSYPNMEQIDIIYKSTLPGSAGRRLMVAAYVLDARPGWIGQGTNGINTEFLLDLSRALLQDREATAEALQKYKDLVQGTPCTYHAHRKDEPCGNGK